jgi:hydroxymethylglutaryl-CoA lyase
MAQTRNANAVKIVEVGPRDGLQNISDVVPTATKLALIERLYNSGLQTVEITSVVSPRAVPQLSDCTKVLHDSRIQTLLKVPNTHLPVLIPNLKGFEIAKQHNVQEVAVIVSASEGFSRANIKCSVQEGLDRAQAIAVAARKAGILVRGYVYIFHRQCCS